MGLQALEIHNLRCLTAITWTPSARLNIIVGANGAGKTSLLEALSLLATARALRPGGAAGARRHGTAILRVRGEGGVGLDQVTIGYERNGSQRRWTLNGETQHSPLAIYRRLPLLVLSPESHYAVLRDAALRRASVHWALFHVEPLFLEGWRRYQRILRQRNAALRHHDPMYRQFDVGLAQTGEVLAGYWQALIDRIGPLTLSYAATLGVPLTVGVSVRRGWGGTDLLAALRADAGGDIRLGYTQSGPHHADVVFTLDGRPLQQVGSHGQQRLVINAWRLALAEAVAATAPPLLLIDDLPAELDHARRALFTQLLADSDGQVFVTATEWPDRVPPGAAVFHVEHGRLQVA